LGIKSNRKIFNFALILLDYGKIKNLALAISKIIVILPALMLYETLPPIKNQYNMKLKLIIILFIFSISAKSQSLSENDIIGTWNVINMQSKIQNPNMKPLIDAFKKGIFKFNENKNFELSSIKSNSLFAMVSEMTKGTKWKYNSETNLIRIGTEDDKYSTMGIQLITKNNKIVFYLEESTLKLEMKKQK